MNQVLMKNGNIVVDEVPSPQLEDGTVLVDVEHSCISPGTELSGLENQSKPLWKRALENPNKVKKAYKMFQREGLKRTYRKVSGKLGSSNAMGYSAAGRIISVGDGVKEFSSGELVACAGSQCAHHAEVIRVPSNLVTSVPNNLTSQPASTVALGSIALQGVRRVSPTLGETFVVLGLGAVGQLTAQLLKCNGCEVIATDLRKERVELAKELGIDHGFDAESENQVERVKALTDGHGADGVIITASTPSDEVVSQAFDFCRKKGRVVLVGDVGLNLNRSDFYRKELDFLISTSYGPGRYDQRYEEEGLDYPIGYVRWTERRNMSKYLDLLNDGQLDVDSLIDDVYPLDQAKRGYEALQRDDRPLMVLISYPESSKNQENMDLVVRTREASPTDKIRTAVVGAGSFAKSIHLPNLRQLSSDFHLRSIVSRTGTNANDTANRFDADYATTNYREVLEDDETDAVLISTRHDLHAEMTLAALREGKHVFVEKPLALNSTELGKIKKFFESKSETPVLLTGFNRRFSPYTSKIKDQVKTRRNPLVLNYRMNAGHIPLDHWTQTEEGGGRNLGEACHIYDLFTFFTESNVENINVNSIKPETDHYTHRDNFVATMDFRDGSTASLTYTALGHEDHPKELLEVYGEHTVIELKDYLELTSRGQLNVELSTSGQKKGHYEELVEFAESIKKPESDWPIPLSQQLQATEIALEVEEKLTGSEA